jgi:hypothetical protein
MKTFKQFQEAIVRHGIRVSFHNDGIDYHKDDKLLHSQKGNYSPTNKRHQSLAYSTAERLQSNPDHYKIRPNYYKK